MYCTGWKLNVLYKGFIKNCWRKRQTEKHARTNILRHDRDVPIELEPTAWNHKECTANELEFVHMQKQIQIFFSMVAAPCFGSIGAAGPNSWQKNKWFLISQDRCPPPFHGSANNILQIISINLAIGFRHKLRKINGAYNEDGRRHLSYIQDIFYKSHDVYIESRVMCQDNVLTCIIFPILQYRGTLHMYFTFIYLTILLKARSNHNE